MGERQRIYSTRTVPAQKTSCAKHALRSVHEFKGACIPVACVWAGASCSTSGPQSASMVSHARACFGFIAPSTNKLTHGSLPAYVPLLVSWFLRVISCEDLSEFTHSCLSFPLWVFIREPNFCMPLSHISVFARVKQQCEALHACACDAKVRNLPRMIAVVALIFKPPAFL